MKSSSPFKSAGARIERKAFRAYLRRLLKDALTPQEAGITNEILQWVLTRQERYDKQKGGLGKR